MNKIINKAVLKAQKGGDRAFELLFKKCHGKVYHFVCSLGPLQQSHVKDIIQETFISVFENINRINKVDKFESWLLSIAYRKSLNLLRTEKINPKFELNINILVKEFENEKLEFIRKELELTAIEIVVDKLKDQMTKDIAKLYYFEGKMNSKQISEEKGIPISTVTTKLSRLRAQIKKTVFIELMKLEDQIIVPYKFS